MLLTKKITKNYGNLAILKDISIEIQKAEIASIVGASGAGKSTLLHIIGSLDTPDSGEVLIDGVNLFSLNAKELAAFRNKKIGFIFQFHHLLPEFTALENVCIPAWVQGVNNSKAKQYATELLHKLSLHDRMHHKPSQLSGGEQQRVAIARALINKPAIVLADEPTGNLDTNNSNDIFEIIKMLRNDYQQTFVLVTHNEELASKCDKKFTMKDGYLITN